MANPNTLFQAFELLFPEFSKKIISYSLVVGERNVLKLLDRGFNTYYFYYQSERDWRFSTKINSREKQGL